jgi:hypothetical protein
MATVRGMSPAVQSHTGLNATVRSALWTDPPCRARWPAVCARPEPGVGQQLAQSVAMAAVSALRRLIRALGTRTSMFGDDVWIADSTTPVECGRSRETAKRSDLAGFAEYGYCASHSRYFWGLRLHLVCKLHGLPIAAAVTGAKADERHVLLGMLDDADLAHQIAGTTLIADKNYYGRDFETTLTAAGIDLLRPTRKGEKTRPGGQFFKPLRQNVESVFDTPWNQSSS